jgi:hypothetical protein
MTPDRPGNDPSLDAEDIHTNDIEDGVIYSITF